MSTAASTSGYDRGESGYAPTGPRMLAWLVVVVISAVAMTMINPSPSGGTYHRLIDKAGYWMVGQDGTVTPFGAASDYGDVVSLLGQPAPSPVVAMTGTPTAMGYMILTEDGQLYFFGDAVEGGSIRGQLAPGELAAAVSTTPSGQGYWIFTNLGRVLKFGDAEHFRDLSSFTLAGPIVSSVPTPSGDGYYMLGSDGGVFAFGDAAFHGSIPQVLPGVQLACPIVGLVPTPSGSGYWLVACDGGVFAFGDAGFVGSIPGVLPGVQLAAEINGMVAYGNGYLMAAFDGGVFNFATNLDFQGSLGGVAVPAPIVGVVPLKP